MRRRVGKIVVVAVAVVGMFFCVCCSMSEDAPSRGIAVEEVGETVSEDEALILSSENETATGMEEIPEKTDSGEISEIVEEPAENLEDKNLIFYVCDDKVWENEVFRAFLEGETTAYDRHQEEALTWSEYFSQDLEDNNGILRGIQLALEDLDGDGIKELMVIFDDYIEATTLYVFHEEEGKLYAWDKVDNFVVIRGNDVVLRDGGIFEDVRTIGNGKSANYTWRFNKNGEVEYIWYFREELDYVMGEDGTEYIRSNQSLLFYEDGECVKELSNIWQMPEWQQDWSEAELVEGDEDFDEIYSALIDDLPEEIGTFSFPRWADDAVEIPIWEVPGGQGWVSVEDPPENCRKFEYVGEDGNTEGNEAIPY